MLKLPFTYWSGLERNASEVKLFRTAEQVAVFPSYLHAGAAIGDVIDPGAEGAGHALFHVDQDIRLPVFIRLAQWLYRDGGKKLRLQQRQLRIVQLTGFEAGPVLSRWTACSITDVFTRSLPVTVSLP